MTDGIIQQVFKKFQVEYLFKNVEKNKAMIYAIENLQQELIEKIKQESFIIDGRIPYVQLHKLIGDNKE